MTQIQLTTDDYTVCNLLGLSPEAYRAQRAKENGVAASNAAFDPVALDAEVTRVVAEAFAEAKLTASDRQVIALLGITEQAYCAARVSAR